MMNINVLSAFNKLFSRNYFAFQLSMNYEISNQQYKIQRVHASYPFPIKLNSAVSDKTKI